jgi:hypothetical protein
MVSKKTDFPYGDLYTDLSPKKWKIVKILKKLILILIQKK